jgi:hypothetical protein
MNNWAAYTLRARIFVPLVIDLEISMAGITLMRVHPADVTVAR